jgi:hypothetical protein
MELPRRSFGRIKVRDDDFIVREVIGETITVRRNPLQTMARSDFFFRSS